MVKLDKEDRILSQNQENSQKKNFQGPENQKGFRGESKESVPEKEIKLIIESKIKAAVPELQVSSDVPDVLNKKILELLNKGSERAKLNGRRTLYARDL